jgi:CRP/FNR family transcriptional regulator
VRDVGLIGAGLSVSIALQHEPALDGRPAAGSAEGASADGASADGASVDGASADGANEHGVLRYRRNAMLYRMGEPRTCLYYIATGVVALLRQTPAGQRQIVEFAFAGDVLGYGLFKHHTSWAQAVGEVCIKRLPLAALDQILHSDKRAFERYAEALRREFEYRRNQLVNAERSLLNRLAALLVALSRQNALEGRDPRVVGDELGCGAVAAWLGVDVRELAHALMELEHSGVIEQCPPNGVRLSQLAGLERLAEELPLSVPSDAGVDDRLD